ncbi:MAG: hypothetical protein LBE91_18475, partial [Tannerella sp.]|nr:hypothetical protein [Tannerella sp.]
MKNQIILTILLAAFSASLLAQKKPLDHMVYDSWQSVSGVQVSNDGKFAVYNISPQDGDTVLIIKNIK